MRRRAMSRPSPINTGLGHYQSKSEIALPLVPPLTPATEKELRKSCSLLLLNPPPKSHARVQSHLPLPHCITDERELPAFPKSPCIPPSAATGGIHTPNSVTINNAFPAFATARKLSVGGNGPQDVDYNLRASQIEIRRVFNDSNSIRSSTTTDRTSAFLLAKPTLVDVLPSPRPRTAGTTSSAGWGGAPLTPMKGNGHEKTDSSDSNRCDRQFSLFPRPRTAHGGEALPQSPLPPPPPAPADRPLPPLPPSKLGTAEVIEVKQVETKKGKKTGFVQFSAFFKATFRFGKKVRSVAHAA